MPDPTLEGLLLQKATSIGPETYPNFQKGMMPLPSVGGGSSLLSKVAGRSIPEPSPWLGRGVTPSGDSLVEELVRLAKTKVAGWTTDKAKTQLHNLQDDGILPNKLDQVKSWFLTGVPTSPQVK